MTWEIEIREENAIEKAAPWLHLVMFAIGLAAGSYL